MVEWAKKDEEYSRVAKDRLQGDFLVSTVWLGLNCRIDGTLPPLIFETMVFEGPDDEYCRRYSTFESALEGHRNIVAALSRGDPLATMAG